MSRKKNEPPPRPVRGTADATRARLLDTAARVFNDVGYLGTDSNKLARLAGYAPGTFYRHFPDKRAIFLAAYARWVQVEWETLSQKVEAAGAADLELAGAVVKFMVAHHRQWRTFRASARALAATDDAARRFFLSQRKAQLELIGSLRRRAGREDASPEADLLLLLTLERACDALAEEEVGALGGGRERLLRLLLEKVQQHLA
jgi:AcrR family transcriptional regulator